MLVIAIPKSAGTSFTMTLANLHGLTFEEGVTDYKESVTENIVELRHGSIGDVTKSDIELFQDKNKLFHEHIFPTKNNLFNLRRQKKIILLRVPIDILHSWWRSEKAGIHPPHPMLFDCKTEKEYVEKAIRLGAIDILQNFKDGWEKNRNENDLIVYYGELMRDPQRAINKSEAHLGLHRSKKVRLIKIRYSRGNRLRNFSKKAYNKLNGVKLLRDAKRKFFPNLTFG